jgi:hypothetical protein
MKKLLLMFGIFAGLSLAAVSCGAEEAKTEESAEGDKKECTKDSECCKKGEKCAKGDKCCKKGGKEFTKGADAEGKCAGKCGDGKCADKCGDKCDSTNVEKCGGDKSDSTSIDKCGEDTEEDHKCGDDHSHE